MKRPSSPFAPPEIELPEPLFTALRHQIRVHEVVRGFSIVLSQGSAVIKLGQYLRSKAESEHSALYPEPAR